MSENGKAAPSPRPPKIPAPWLPAPYTGAIAHAIRACIGGTATEHQQKLAMNWIINVASNADDMSYRPGGLEGDRDSAFAEGRRYVGNQIKKLFNLPLSITTQGEN